jgi:hypothetical protein
MKTKILFFTLMLITASFTTAQNLKATTIKLGDKIKLGNGTLENGNFKYIYVNGNDLLEMPKINLDASFSNLNVQIIGIKKVGNERIGYKTFYTVWIDEDSIPTVAKNAYKKIGVTGESIEKMKNELKVRQADFDEKASSMPESIKVVRLAQLKEMPELIRAYEIKNEKLLDELSTIRWVLDFDSALSAGEITK